ncbi:hypothetical protein HNQ08_004880 [Deinococcus humi]|uniref:Uncharacterized protein n=1 Tax=Deinococcus humi TaxID=662880 RepID=A0A7W8K1W4_9DEIO|nr:hypothetical protein [Deinococcus humi]
MNEVESLELRAILNGLRGDPTSLDAESEDPV